jgi:mono/diheme cytochrome c family protein
MSGGADLLRPQSDFCYVPQMEISRFDLDLAQRTTFVPMKNLFARNEFQRGIRKMPVNRIRNSAHCLAIVVGAVSAIYSLAATAQEAPRYSDAGDEQEFLNSCASCHGADGRGSGPLATVLKIQPTNLTELTKNNGGVFPYDRLFETIDGRNLVAGHGDRDMPIWGERFKLESEQGQRLLPAEVEVRNRLFGLVMYIKSIQE